MKDQNHFAKNEINSKLKELRDQYEAVLKLCEERAHRLADSLLSQQYYAEANETEQWMHERLPRVSIQDTGNSQAAAESHLRRLAILEQEIGKYADEIKRLRLLSEKLINANHFDSTKLTATQAKVEELYQNLEHECRRRRTQLIDAGR